MPGHVYIVGAGCGGVDWLTVRARALLERCDVVVYDELIDPALPELAPPEAERICAGKRAGLPSAKQEDINALLVEKARRGNAVVRLKGGDPFVFGRGGEEALALAEADVPYTLVPGVTSALAIPMEFGISVTHRGLSRSVHIVTARTMDGSLPENLPQLAALDGTLVFLMGLGALDTLARGLIEAGKSPDTPAAVLSGGNSPRPAEARGTLADVAERAKAAGVQAPAVVVLGETARMDLRDRRAAALTVGLTGTPEFQEKLARLLERSGLLPYPVQRARCAGLSDPIPWETLAGRWLVFTSARGVEFFFRRLAADKADIRRLYRSRFAVIGPGTAEALASHGVRADLCPVTYTGEALAEALLNNASDGGGFFLFDSAKGSVPEALARAGVSCRRISLYDTVYETLPQKAAPLRFLLFGSAGAVNALADDGYFLDADTTAVCIGPVCAAAFKRRFQREPVVAEESTAEAMVRAVITRLESPR